jgi:hypothetical protein
MKTVKEQICLALQNLGIKGKVKVSQAGISRYKVEVNGKYFGIFDMNRNTFVD